MKTISLWAKNNSGLAILFVAILNLVLIIAGSLIGILLTSLGIHFPLALLYFVPILLIAIVLLHKNYAHNYWRKKLMHLFIILLSFASTIVASNMLDNIKNTSPLYASSTPYSHYRFSITENLSKENVTKKQKRALKKLQRQQLKKVFKYQKRGTNWKGVALIILLTIIGAFAGVILIALVCNLICTGHIAGAIALALFGSAGLILGLAALARFIDRKFSRKKVKTAKRSFIKHPNTSI